MLNWNSSKWKMTGRLCLSFLGVKATLSTLSSRIDARRSRMPETSISASAHPPSLRPCRFVRIVNQPFSRICKSIRWLHRFVNLVLFAQPGWSILPWSILPWCTPIKLWTATATVRHNVCLGDSLIWSFAERPSYSTHPRCKPREIVLVNPLRISSCSQCWHMCVRLRQRPDFAAFSTHSLSAPI